MTTMNAPDPLLSVMEPIAVRAARAEGVDVAWCELKGGLAGRIFRVFIERVDGDVGLSDCERVTKRLSVLLDVEDPIESSYTLEVSTPGLDRPLHRPSDYERFRGRLARLKTRQMVDGRRRFVGRLAGLSGDSVRIDENGRVSEIPLSLIDTGRLEVELDFQTGSARPDGSGERADRDRRGAHRDRRRRSTRSGKKP